MTVVASAMVALSTILPGRLAAQAKVFYACYVPSSGTVYRIREPGLPQQCSTSTKKGQTLQHVEFSWTDGAGAQAGSGDHGVLAGLLDDDHSQYLLTDGARTSLNGFAVDGTLYQGSIPASGPGARFMWYAGKAALRAGYTNGAQWDDANIGVHSIAAGSNAIASGVASVALGTGEASGNVAVAIGASPKATGTNAVAIGRLAEATGTYSVAIGNNTKAQGSESFAFGRAAIASIGSSFSIGEHTVADSYKGFAIGQTASTNGQYGAMVISTATTNAALGIQVKAVAQAQFVARASRFWFGNNENVTAPGGQLIVTSTGAHLTVGGTWVNSSDVNRKANFAPVDGEQILGRIAAMPVQTWNYRDEEESVRHIGPTAQDFSAAFGLGANETSIATVDADGVSLAAIQALERRTTELQRENASLRGRIDALDTTTADLNRANEQLRAELRSMAARLERMEVVRPSNPR